MTSTGLRELDHRIGDRLEVTMVWDPVADRVFVGVDDALTGEHHVIPVRDGQRPLDVFHHPFAYLATLRQDAPAALIR